MRGKLLLSVALACLPLVAATGQSPPKPYVPLPPPPSLPQSLPPPVATPLSPAEAGPPPEACDQAHPITLQAALELSGARVLDVQLAGARVREAMAELKRAQVLWLPTVYVGGDYFRHDGQIQDVAGKVFTTSRSALLLGGAPYAVFSTGDALFAPKAAREVVAARHAQFQASENDSMLAVAVAYYDVQQARGELVGTLLTARYAEDLVKRTQALSESVVAPVEVVRARAEASRTRQQAVAARERWRTASAELARLLRLPPQSLVEPAEPPNLKVTIVPPDRSLDELIPLALTYRPELAAQQALVQATLERLRQEKLRPLMPSVLLRGAATNPAGTLSSGYFGGGVNSTLTNFSGRNDVDVQLLWEFQNLGLGNRARVKAEQARNEQATIALFQTQDRIASEVVQAHAQVRSARDRVREAEVGLRDALQSARMNFEGLQQTKQAGRNLTLVIRPQEAVASIRALAQAYADYYGAIGDYDRGQFRLYRALGQPPQDLFDQACPAGQGEAPKVAPAAHPVPQSPPILTPAAPPVAAAPPP